MNKPTDAQVEAALDAWDANDEEYGHVAMRAALIAAGVVAEEPESLTEKELYDLPHGAIVMRSWSGVDPDIYERRGGWWVELTNAYTGRDVIKESLGVVWSDHARFTTLWAPIEQEGAGDEGDA